MMILSNTDKEMYLSIKYNIPIAKVGHLKKVRNENMGTMSDDELMKFHIEWTAVCKRLRGGK